MAPFDTSYINCFLPDPIRFSIKVLRGATVILSLVLLVHAEPVSCIAIGMLYAWACLNNCRPASPAEHRKMAGGSEPTENIQKCYEPINHFLFSGQEVVPLFDTSFLCQYLFHCYNKNFAAQNLIKKFI